MNEMHVYKVAAGCEIRIDVHASGVNSGGPAIFWVHGGALIGGNRGNIKQEQLDWYLAQGYAVFSIDYRLAPETKVPGIIEDVRDAWAWVRREGPALAGIDPDRMAVIGGSAGGYLTLMAGFCVRPRPKALVSFYGYGDLVGPWYSEPDEFYCRQPAVPKEEAYAAVGARVISTDEGTQGRWRYYLYLRQNGLWPLETAGFDPHAEPEKFDPYQPVKNVTPEYPPTMLFHGTADTDVPYGQSVMMAKELARVGVEHEFITIPEGGHGFDGHGFKVPAIVDAFDRMLAFLRRHV